MYTIFCTYHDDLDWNETAEQQFEATDEKDLEELLKFLEDRRYTNIYVSDEDYNIILEID